MAVITKIQVQKNNQERYSIYIDKGSGEEYGFSVDEHTLITHSLKKGMEIDELELGAILYDEEVRKAYLQAVSYLSYQMRTRQEVEEYLSKKEIGQAVMQEVVRKLHEEAYINDTEYALAYVRTHSSIHVKGVQRIWRELQAKGVQEDIITLSLQEYPKEMQITNAIALCEKKKKTYKHLSLRQQRQKLEEMLMRKGYPRDIIMICLEELQDEPDTDEEWEALQQQGRKYHEKYKKYSGREYEMKMKGALYRKGFPLELIERFLQELEQE